MDNEDVVYIYNRLLFSMRKEILPFAATWMGLEGTMLSEHKSDKTNTAWHHLYVE